MPETSSRASRRRGRSSREKGARGELEAARALRDVLRLPVTRGFTTSPGTRRPDLLTPIPGIRFEVRRRERLRVRSWAQELAAKVYPEHLVLLCRTNHMPWLCCLWLDDLRDVAVEISKSLNRRGD